MHRQFVQPGSSRRRGFTFVELLIVIAVIGMLGCLFLPAIHVAREAARRSQCKHHLRRIAFGCLKHENAHQTFPYGGWSFGWMGDPDQGIGPQQPGSWIYTTGRFMGLRADFEIGTGLPWDEKRAALAEQMATFVPVFYCPSRRPAKAYPAFGPTGISCENGVLPKNSLLPPKVAKSDYAINGGTGDGWESGAGGTGGAPEVWCLKGYTNGITGTTGAPAYPDCNWHIGFPDKYWQRFNGVCGWRIGARINQISDGVSKTVLVGEKLMQPYYYEHSCPGTGAQPSKGNAGDNGSMYMGWDIDVARTGGLARDHNAENPVWGIGDRLFGGPHPHAANIAFCDGSVRSIRYGVKNFERLVTRNDSDSVSN